MTGYIIGYIVLAAVAALLGFAIWRIVRRRSSGCCGDTRTGGKVFSARNK